jgi:PST family polysaccharide transporter/lipopolysaccharide exporter
MGGKAGTGTPKARPSARDVAVADGRLDPSVQNLRVHTARGTIINSAFQVGLALLGLLKRLGVAAFLTREEFGIWGILLASMVTLVWIKQVGIMDKYIQQAEPDQETAFQKAFTLELIMSSAYFALCCLALPVYAMAYGHTEIILPGVVLATAVLLTAFQTPAWIPYRQMRYVQQRVLSSVDPVVSVLVTIGLAAAGLGYWALVFGSVAGALAGAAACVFSSPYRLGWRLDRETVREYASFSLPLMGQGITRMIVVQGALLAANSSAGLAGVGVIGLAVSFAVFADRVGQIISQTVYPAVCAVADRVDQMAEVFTKSNRLGLMWAMPFATGLALFAGDLVNFVFGDEWNQAVGMIAGVALICGFGQIAFNWTVFMRAANQTRPIFVAALFDFGVFVVALLPLTLKYGITGYAAGFGIGTVVQIALRGYFMNRLLRGFGVFRHALRAIAPMVPATGLILVVRLATQDLARTPGQAVGELVLFLAAAAFFTWIIERRLVTEVLGYVRGRVDRRPLLSNAAVAK